MKRWLIWLNCLLCLLAPGWAVAATYTFPTSMPGTCSGSGGTYSCTSLNLSSGDIIVIAGTKPATINIAGNPSLTGVKINTAGAASDLTLVISGDVNWGTGTDIVGNVRVTNNFNLSNGAKITGDAQSTSQSISLGASVLITGKLTAANGINFNGNAQVTSCVRASSGNISLASGAKAGSICCGSMGSCTNSCLINNSGLAAPGLCTATPAIASFGIAGTGAASTCTPQTLTLTAKDSGGATLTGYTGTVNLSTSSGRGDWSAGSGPAPAGTLTAGAANSGLASYTFSASDAGVVKLRLSHSLAQTLTVTVVDAAVSASSSTSASISFSNNAFEWAVVGNLAIAGRNQAAQVSLIKKDPSTGRCGVATDFTGSRNLKLWRTDTGGPWTAPSVVSPALTVPASRPGSNNLTLSFSSGVANFNLATTDVGRYALNLDDDSGTYASSTISGSLSDLTVRPLAIAVSGLTLSGTANPAGSAATDAVFGKAGASFSATLAAYRWSAAADSNNDGVVDSTATLSQLSSGGLAAGFNSTVTLGPVAGTQTPAGGTLGSLSNGAVSGFTSGSVTVNNLAYSEVGSFTLNTSSVVTNYLGASGVTIDAVVFDAAGSPQTRVGRFVPAGFALSSPAITHRSSQACSPASAFTYLGENFQLGFTLTAQNTAGATTTNYTGAFAKLDFSTASNLHPAGIGGSTPFKTGGRLQLGTGSGSWVNGVATGATLTAQVSKSSSTPDGPFDTAQFGISALDSDGVGMVSLNLDTDSPADSADVTLVGTISLRHGRLRLQNALGAANRALKLPLTAQYWNGSAFVTNTLDSCTRVSSSNLSAGNLRKQLLAADIVMTPSSVTVSGSSPSYLTLAAPGSGRVGSVDIALALGSSSTDASCLASSWASKTTTASSGANLDGLRHTWCSSSSLSDPSARATWGLYRGSDGVVFQRENY
ncbi:DUF6701 domain-containing protein [Roseateles paludis]|uniref:DUF6701 domain-containing protein n=1 Tax=Roseateles paludis TaxID=3145238 RepID=A0ABV0G7W5_9BURK